MLFRFHCDHPSWFWADFLSFFTIKMQTNRFLLKFDFIFENWKSLQLVDNIFVLLSFWGWWRETIVCSIIPNWIRKSLVSMLHISIYKCSGWHSHSQDKNQLPDYKTIKLICVFVCVHTTCSFFRYTCVK